jgi:hypothetical protein
MYGTPKYDVCDKFQGPALNAKDIGRTESLFMLASYFVYTEYLEEVLIK